MKKQVILNKKIKLIYQSVIGSEHASCGINRMRLEPHPAITFGPLRCRDAKVFTPKRLTAIATFKKITICFSLS